MAHSTTERHNLLWLTIFAITMAYLESALVVYLRRIFYPAGFTFPLVEADPATFLIELGREAATIVMLVAVGRLSAVRQTAGRGWSAFACFAFLFGMWDIWYYVWLKVFLGWPASLLTFDILFLIPVVWIGPVLAPVLVSVLLVAGGIAAMRRIEAGRPVRVYRRDWLIATGGALLILWTFMEDAVRLLAQGGVEAVLAFVPTTYNWPVFLAGLAAMAWTAVKIVRRDPSLRSG